MKKEVEKLSTKLVLVTYNPDEKLLSEVILSIKEQVDKIYIVDNTPNKAPCLEYFKDNSVEIIYLEDNMGIAYAQNIGIHRALKDESDYIMLCDQDTIYPNNYIQDMLNIFSTGEKIAAAAPLYRDIRTLQENDGFWRESFFLFKQFTPKSGYYDIFHAIASGKILNAKYLKDIGFMNENLFIDWVDLEWCWRARKKGYKIVGNADVVVNHRLGDNIKNIGSKQVSIRNHIRHYYITRNALYLALYTKHLSAVHRVTLAIKPLKYIVGFTILSKPHFTNFRYVLLGFWHGLIGKLGRLK